MEPIEHNLYDRREQFDAWEIACLVAGFEPESIDRNDKHGLPGRVRTLLSMIDEAYKAALLLNVAQIYEEDGTPVGCLPSDIPIDLPSLPSVELRRSYHREVQKTDDADNDLGVTTQNPKFLREDIKKWLVNVGWKEARYFMAQHGPQEKALASRERETLLKLVIGMAVIGYRYDVTAKKGDAVSEIVKDVESIGLSISDETVRKYLKEAAKLLPEKPHKN